MTVRTNKHKFLLITLYDTVFYGGRILSSIIKRENFECHIVFLKDIKGIPIVKDKDEYLSYQYLYNGLLRGSCYAVDKITHDDINILIHLIREVSPDVIGLSTRSFAYEICLKIFPLVKKYSPGPT